MTSASGMHFHIRPIEPAETHGLRRSVLRADAPDDESMAWDCDEQPGALHMGAETEGRIVGIASVFPEAAPWAPAEHEGTTWRLRGMATEAALRGRGIGKIVLMACMQHILEEGGTLLWCNARTGAVPFYGRLGFAIRSEEFDIPGIGPHFVMSREIPGD